MHKQHCLLVFSKKMPRLMLLLTTIAVICLFLCACDSDNLKQAKEAYKNGDFQNVIELLSSEDQSSEETKNLLALSHAHVSSNNGNYSEAFNFLSGLDTKEAKNYQDAIVDSATGAALETGSTQELAGILKQNSEYIDNVFEDTTASCKEMNYNAYKVIDDIVASDLPEQNKAEFDKFNKENTTGKLLSFLIGTWEWQSGNTTQTHINVKPYQDSAIGIVTVVGDNEIDYQIQVGDIYWTDFTVIDGTTYTCMNLSKTRSGSVVDTTALGTVDFNSPNTLNIHVTAPAPYTMVNAERNWIRIQ